MPRELSDVLQDFRQDLDAFFKAQKKHNSTRQRLQDVYLRLLRAEPPAAPAPPVATPGAVGIAGVGKSSESPDSKGSKAKRQAISLQELGGEASIRETLTTYFVGRGGRGREEIQQSMQDVWVDEVSDKRARVSVLFSKPKPECIQLVLQREKDGRWQVMAGDEEGKVGNASCNASGNASVSAPVARDMEASRLLQDALGLRLSSPKGSPEKSEPKPEPPKRLVGKSPLFRPKDVPKLFEEIDADGDGKLSKRDLLPFLRDYLGYGHAEVLSFLEVYGKGNSAVELADFKRGLKDLNPHAVYNRENQLIVRKPHAFGGIEGVDFHLEDCTGCTCLICDKSEEFKVDALKNCRVLIGPCSSSSFIRNCEGCTFWVATKQFRVRDCSNCTFYLHCHTEPVIEASKDLRIAPFHASYPGLKKQFQDAGFDPQLNFWNAVYDFTGNSKHANWSIPALDECEKLLVTFEGCATDPEVATPELTQELLVAEPLQSSESHGQSVASVPQTRPPLPKSPGTKRLRRCVSDAAQDITGVLEAVILSDGQETSKPEAAAARAVTEGVAKREETRAVADPIEEVLEILDMHDEAKEGKLQDLFLRGRSASNPVPSSGSKARITRPAAWSMPGAAASSNGFGRPLGAMRLTPGGAAAAPKAPSVPTAPTLDKILNDSSDEDMIFAPRTAAAAKVCSAAARQKIGERIDVLSSLDSSDGSPLVDKVSTRTERQKNLMKEALAGLGMTRMDHAPSFRKGRDASSSEEEIIIEDEAAMPTEPVTAMAMPTEPVTAQALAPRQPAGKAKASASADSESTSESDDDEAFKRWTKKLPKHTAPLSD